MKPILIITALLLCLPLQGWAQDAQDAGKDMTKLYSGLFTAQPQYPTPGTTIMNGDPVPADTSNPLKGLFSPQPQYPTPGTTIMNPEPQATKGDNPLNGFFMTQPQYPTPGTTIMNPTEVPKILQEQNDGSASPYVISPAANAKSKTEYDNPGFYQTSVPPTWKMEKSEALPHYFGPAENPKQGAHVFDASTHPSPQPYILNPSAAPAHGIYPEPVTAPHSLVAPAHEKPAAATKTKAKEETKDKTKSAKQKSKRKESKPVKAAPENKPVPPDYSALRQSLVLFHQGRYLQGLDIIEQALQETPSDPEAHYLKAIFLVKLRKYPEAAGEYKEVIEMAEHTPLGERAQSGLKMIGY